MDRTLSPDEFDILTALIGGQVLFNRGGKWYLSTPVPSLKKGLVEKGAQRRQVKGSTVRELIEGGLIEPQAGDYIVTEQGLELLIDTQEGLTEDLTTALGKPGKEGETG